jgi:DNA modification methylase
LRIRIRLRNFRKLRSRFAVIFWNLGKHKLLVGDATNQSDVAKLMGGEAADLAFLDPPYNRATV